MEVTTHQSPISVNGWQGSGYSVLDPETGVGAYQISGGASGGFLLVLALFMIVIISGVLTGGWALLGAAWAAVNFAFWISSINDAMNYEEFNNANLIAALALLMGMWLVSLGIVGLSAEGLGLLIFAEGFTFLLGLI